MFQSGGGRRGDPGRSGDEPGGADPGQQPKPATTAPAAKTTAKAAKPATAVQSAQGVVKSMDASTLVIAEKERQEGHHEVKFVLDPAMQKDGNVAVGSNGPGQVSQRRQAARRDRDPAGRRQEVLTGRPDHKAGAWPPADLQIRPHERPGVPGRVLPGRGSGLPRRPHRPPRDLAAGAGSFSKTTSSDENVALDIGRRYKNVGSATPAVNAPARRPGALPRPVSQSRRSRPRNATAWRCRTRW